MGGMQHFTGGFPRGLKRHEFVTKKPDSYRETCAHALGQSVLVQVSKFLENFPAVIEHGFKVSGIPGILLPAPKEFFIILCVLAKTADEVSLVWSWQLPEQLPVVVAGSYLAVLHRQQTFEVYFKRQRRVDVHREEQFTPVVLAEQHAETTGSRSKPFGVQENSQRIMPRLVHAARRFCFCAARCR